MIVYTETGGVIFPIFEITVYKKIFC